MMAPLSGAVNRPGQHLETPVEVDAALHPRVGEVIHDVGVVGIEIEEVSNRSSISA